MADAAKKMGSVVQDMAGKRLAYERLAAGSCVALHNDGTSVHLGTRATDFPTGSAKGQSIIHARIVGKTISSGGCRRLVRHPMHRGNDGQRMEMYHSR